MVTKHQAPISHEMNPSESSASCCQSSSLTNVLLIVLIVLNVGGLYLLGGNSLSIPGISPEPIGLKKVFLEMEYNKSGGKDNYELVSKAQQLSLNDPQNPSNINSMKQYIESFGPDGTKQGGTQPTAQAPSANDVPQTIADDKLKTVLDSATIQGNKNADIIAIEYSDTECPFCVKQYQETKLWPMLQEKYGDKVSFAFKNNRGVNHPGTEAKAIGALCAKKIGGDDAYVKFYTTVMDGSTQSAGVYDVSKLPDAAKIAGVDEKKWKECFDAKETQSIFVQETNEAQGFGLGGTPGTLLLNIKTGKYITVEGAYPFEQFVQKIDSLMN